jgi:RNA polymerase sigma-70 factor (ECF subfamily)
MTHADDRNLLRLTHRGDDRAARELWARWGGLLRSYARSIVPHAADDIVQRALCRMMQRRSGEIAAVVDVRAWLVTLTRHEAISYRRAERREQARAAKPRPTSHADPSDTGVVQAALASLPRVLREVVTLKHASGMTFEQMAEVLGANRHTVAWRYSRGIELLRHRLGASGGCEPSVSDSSEVVHAAR